VLSNPQRPEHLFIVRLWCEPSQAHPPGEWRGLAEHVPSGGRAYFCSLDDLGNFIQAHTAADGGLPPWKPAAGGGPERSAPMPEAATAGPA
jgi:hypothetical protein